MPDCANCCAWHKRCPQLELGRQHGYVAGADGQRCVPVRRGTCQGQLKARVSLPASHRPAVRRHTRLLAPQQQPDAAAAPLSPAHHRVPAAPCGDSVRPDTPSNALDLPDGLWDEHLAAVAGQDDSPAGRQYAGAAQADHHYHDHEHTASLVSQGSEREHAIMAMPAAIMNVGCTREPTASNDAAEEQPLRLRDQLQVCHGCAKLMLQGPCVAVPCGAAHGNHSHFCNGAYDSRLHGCA